MIQEYIENNLRGIARTLEVIILAAWLVSQFVPSINDWMRQQRIIELVGLVLIIEIVSAVADIKAKLSEPLSLYPDQASSSQKDIMEIHDIKPAIAKFIGLSAGKREEILNTLTRTGWEIRLLIQHPDAAMNDTLKHHLEEKIQELANVTFINYKKVEVRLYKRPCYVRGTKLGKRVDIGWYACGEGVYELFGHSNPVLSAREGTPQATYLEKFFDKSFDYLWNHRETIPLKIYYDQTKLK